MIDRIHFVFLTIFLFCSVSLLAQEEVKQEEIPKPDPLFVRATIWPTANLSRYDYNNDVDLYEIRAYVELRNRTPIGDVIDDAQVYVHSQALTFKDDHYEKRIKISQESLPVELKLRIETQDGRTFKNRFLLPAWLILLNPRPDIVDSSQDLAITWKYTRYAAPVNVHAYNFKTGNKICEKNDLSTFSLKLPADKLPESTIVRIWVIQSWLYKRFLRGPLVARGSEVILIPWSQVFIRAK
jgi:hypothetical protein